MPHMGLPELLLVLVIVVLVFGVGKLPEVGSALGRGIREFRDATSQKPHDEPDDQEHKSA